MKFSDLKLQENLLRAVAAEGYTVPTPIQLQAIPHVLEGRDVLGVAQTGTGKTAAFALPILQKLGATPVATRAIRCLVLAPTRELATQIAESFSVYGAHTGLTNAVVFGGVGQEPQVQRLRRGVDILVATPGRLMDLMDQRCVNFSHLNTLVLDEADRMLDMGFIRDVRRILKALPTKRQTLFFSATMPAEVDLLARQMLTHPVRVEVAPEATTAEKVDQRIYFVHKGDKRGLLVHLLKEAAITRALVFTRTKSGANRVTRQLAEAGVPADVIHGNKSQNARERALDGFKKGETRVLVATDIAARGIDVEQISHVINFDLPNIPESYVHRIGRTARASFSGVAMSFCDAEERAFLRDIERTIRMKVPVVEDHPFVNRSARAETEAESEPRRRPQPPGRRARSSSPQARGGRGGHPPQARPAIAAPAAKPAAAAPSRRFSKWY